MRLNCSSKAKITSGQLINLLSNDVSRFDFGSVFLNFLWIMPLQLLLGIYMTWMQVGISSLAGICTMIIIIIPVQGNMYNDERKYPYFNVHFAAGLFGILSSKYRLKVANRSDQRIKNMTELINGIQVIKMYAWEKPFEKLIQALRKHEVSAIRICLLLKAVYFSLFVFIDRLASFATIICYVLLGYHITADKVYSLAQFFYVMQISIAVGFPQGINSGAEILVTVKRLQEFLTLQEKGLNHVLSAPQSTEICISLNNVNAAWVPNKWKFSNITINIPSGSLCIIIGPVGSGKSSILSLILEELIPSSGTVRKLGEVSYASQDPWIFVGSVRENILFGKPYIRERYREVVRVCALEKDFQLFPYGDKTIVGERGVSLSGGQRARINLARAVYRKADIYMLDDPLSAVDTHVSKHLFQECVKNYLQKRTRILVTHQTHFLKDADYIIIVHDVRI